MSMGDNISFDEQRTKYTSNTSPKGLIGFLINKCGVPDESTANIILIVIAVIFFAFAGFLFYNSLA